jgi:hypothetical protein
MTSASPYPVADRGPRPGGEPLAQRQVALVDLLDRLLAGGVVIAGEVTLRIADVDLVRIHLRALIATIGAEVASPWEAEAPPGEGRTP